MQQINAKLLNKFITDLYKETKINDITLDAGSEMFLNYIKTERRNGTYEYYKCYIGLTMKYLKSKKIENVSEINNKLLLEYITYEKNRGLKNSTRNKLIKTIKYLIHFLEKNEIISKMNITIDKLKENDPEIKTISLKDIQRMLKWSYSASTKEQIMLRLIITTGIRRSELLRIKNKNLNLNENEIYLDETKTGDCRYIFIDDETKNLIERYIKSFKNIKKYIYLFTNEKTNKQYTVGTIDKIFVKIKKELNIEILSSHKLRHTYATSLLEQGANLEQVRKLLGHRTYEMTKRYLHVQNKDIKKTSLALNPLNLTK